jgi:carboxymethylenebutenolidase
MGKLVELTATDGARISAWRADPTGTPRGAVVIAQEIFGVNDHIRSVCDGYATDGYVAIAPALFDRYAPNVDLVTARGHAAGREPKKAGIDRAADVAAARDAVAGRQRCDRLLLAAMRVRSRRAAGLRAVLVRRRHPRPQANGRAVR